MTSTNTAIIPEPVQDPHWFQMHSRFLKEAKNKRGSLPSVLLIGASIIEFMQDAPVSANYMKKVFKEKLIYKKK